VPRAIFIALISSLTYGSAALAQNFGDSADIAHDGPLVEVIVVASSPTRGGELPENQVAGSVQRVDSEQIRTTRGATLADALEQNLVGISLNHPQGSPFLPDLSYRGFTASPLLGLPQGLAVYLNGSRLNEPFGDTLAWELVPEFAIQDATLVTGLNPVYGLNALGGALSLRMKNGFSASGARAMGSFGSFGRLRGGLEAGFEHSGWAIYAGGDVLRETGWRDRSPADLQRLYVDVRRRGEAYELALGASLAHAAVMGNGPSPLELQAQRRQAVFTYPDESKTTAALFVAEGGWSLARAMTLNATAFFRTSVRRTLNGDAAELVPCVEDPSVLCEEEEDEEEEEEGENEAAGAEGEAEAAEPIRSSSGGPIPASAGGEAVYNSTRTASLSGGGTLQLVSRRPILELRNQLTIGAAADHAVSRFRQRTEVGTFTADRGVTGSGYFRGDESGDVELRVSGTQLGAYATDTLELLPRLSLTVSGRVNWFGIRLRDREEDGALNGTHRFARFNPAAGVTYSPTPGFVLYTAYSEANRAPTAAELSCADPEAPCRLPNAFLSDPPLDQVVTRSLELGARWRGRFDGGTQLSASLAAFGARNSRDILFVAGSLVGTGYFRNAGATQRVGLEAGLSARLGSFEPYVRYELLRATFESNLVLPGVNHPNATASDEGPVIFVQPGDRIPTFPMHSARLGALLEPLDALSLGASVHLTSSQYYRGDEANLLSPLPGYATLHASAAYEVASVVSVFVRADNLLSAEFSTFGLLGQPDEVLEDAEDPRFTAPAPPFSVWAGLEVQIAD
jgi:outer membrane receptor protein involved in Fe transport